MEKDDFIKRLTQLRLSKDVSAREMSLSLGMSENYINGLENGAGLPNMATFLIICDYLGITPKEFFDVDMQPKNKALYDLVMQLPGDYVDSLTALIETALKHLK